MACAAASVPAVTNDGRAQSGATSLRPRASPSLGFIGFALDGVRLDDGRRDGFGQAICGVRPGDTCGLWRAERPSKAPSLSAMTANLSVHDRTCRDRIFTVFSKSATDLPSGARTSSRNATDNGLQRSEQSADGRGFRETCHTCRTDRQRAGMATVVRAAL